MAPSADTADARSQVPSHPLTKLAFCYGLLLQVVGTTFGVPRKAFADALASANAYLGGPEVVPPLPLLVALG